MLKLRKLPGVRVNADGSLWIPRRNLLVENVLNAQCHKYPNQLRWHKRHKLTQQMLDIKTSILCADCFIVGKGPSLDNLSKEDFPNEEAIIICINDSIHKVASLGLPNQLYVRQGDVDLAIDTDSNVSFFISKDLADSYPEHTTIIIDSKELGLFHNGIGACVAMEIGKLLGITHFNLMCFDACVNGDTQYADTIGYLPEKGGDPNRFLRHRQIIESITDCTIEWTIPITQRTNELSTSDTPQPSHEHLQ